MRHILPGRAVRDMPVRSAVPAGGTMGTLLYDWPAGPAIAIALAATALIAGRVRRVAAIW